MASPGALNSQMKKGKKQTAAYIHEECCRSGTPLQLEELLNIILDPKKAINDRETIEWCRWLMAAGRTPEEFFSTVRMYDNAITCGLVWTANFVAYRCRTCGISPCMSLCAACFQLGNHEGHDFNMFRSQAGGACDCGDTSVMKATGFCHRHGPKPQLDKPAAPQDLLKVAEAMMPRLILRLIQHLRDHSRPEVLNSYLIAMADADAYVTMLHQWSELGAAMRHVMMQALTNPQIYKDLTEGEEQISNSESDSSFYKRKSHFEYEQAVRALTYPEPPTEFKDFPALQSTLIHRSFLEELVFWTVKFEFPQKLVCLLLNMLPDNNYKDAFTRAFVRHYSRISLMLVKSVDSDTLSNRVVHVSVQLFSNEALALKMAEELHLLQVMVVSLKHMMKSILIPSTLHDHKRNEHMVVDCAHQVMTSHCYWPLVSDLNNVLSHRRVALKFLGDPALLEMWFRFLSYFQGMNVNQRELCQHVKFEPSTYYAAFSAELEASASVMWAMIAHLKDSSTLHVTKEVLSLAKDAILDWFDIMDYTGPEMTDFFQVSFHLPLHRYFAVFLGQAVKFQGAMIDDVIPPDNILKLMIMHPLKAQVAFYEILCGMWVRNGLQIKGQAMTYIQCHFCNSMVDADLFLLQVCSTKVDPDWFITTVLERFHVLEWLSFAPNHVNSFLEQEHEMPMIEGALTFLATLLTVRTNIVVGGLSDEELTKLEMVTLLCMGDKTHSQLIDLMPEKCGSLLQNREFEATLARVADYKAPNFEIGGNMLQGMYVPKADVWEHDYDPVYVLLRAVHRRDFQASMDRFTQYARQSGKFQGSGMLWPPFRIHPKVKNGFVDPCQLLHCKTMHAVIFAILYKAVNDPTVSEMTMALCIYLVEMAIRFPASESSAGKELLQVESRDAEEEVVDMQFKDWYSSNFILTNLQHVITKVAIGADDNVATSDDSDDMEVDSYSEMDLAELPPEMPADMTSEVAVPGGSGSVELSTTHAALPNAYVPLPLPAAPSTQALVPVSGTNMAMMQAGPSFGYSPAQPSAEAPGGFVGNAPSQTVALLDITRRLIRHRRLAGNKINPAKALTASDGSRHGMAMVPSKLSAFFQTSNDTTVSLMSMPATQELDSPTFDEQCAFKELPGPQRNYVEVNESILSLLLKLHSKLSDKPDSFVPETDRPSPSSVSGSTLESRIGDGPHFVGVVLDKVCKLSIRNHRAVQEIRNRLWPQKPSRQKSSGTENIIDSPDKEERRRRAKERQQKLMAEFASKQKAFMETAKTTDATSDEKESVSGAGSSQKMEEDTGINYSRKYDCVICGQTTASTESRPIGLVALLQATSVLGHSHSQHEHLRLPCSDEEARTFQSEENRASKMKKRVEQMLQLHDFNEVSLLMSINIGWEGGVHVQTCGHHLHLDCHLSYLQSLRSQQGLRPQSLAVDKGEYSCPLCRQLANTVLPMVPDVGEVAAVVRSRTNDARDVAMELAELIQAMPPTPQNTSELMKAMGSVLENVTHSTYRQYKFCSNSTHPESLSLFICSVARTNLELEIVQRDGTLCSSNTASSLRRPCFVPLLQMLGTHAKLLTADKPQAPLWSHLTGLHIDESATSITKCEKEVPLMLKDAVSLLLHLILTLPMPMDKAYFTSIVQSLYNVVYIQAVAICSCKMSEEERLRWKAHGQQADPALTSLVNVLGEVIDSLEHSELYLQDDDMDRRMRVHKWLLSDLEAEVQRMCMLYLRLASLLQFHLYKEDLPEIQSMQQEFTTLCQFLNLGRWSTEVIPCASSAHFLAWVVDYPSTVIANWCKDYIAFTNKSQIAARNLLDQHISWYQPRLLRLPESYDKIFQYYHQMNCTKCHFVPKEPSVCLICGVMVCLRESCCRQHGVYEAVQHSINCGAGTAMFLAVNSSIVVVIRGKRACLWGSVYLDSFGEEDRDLKRGKPLYLSHERYRLLEQQWLTHSFDRTNKRWIWHKDSL